jgi:heavy metal efflux system protein
VPDLVNIQVQVVTEAGTLPPLEVERYCHLPGELAVSGLPNVEEVRSISRLGISLVTIVFREGTDIFLARQLVAERLPEAKSGSRWPWPTRSSGPSARRSGRSSSSR